MIIWMFYQTTRIRNMSGFRQRWMISMTNQSLELSLKKIKKKCSEARKGISSIEGIKKILKNFGKFYERLNALQYIQDFGVDLICVEDGIDFSKDSGKLTITLLSAVAEIERENILVQTMKGCFIMKIFDNPVYIGKIVCGRHKAEKVKGSRDEYKRFMSVPMTEMIVCALVL